jgi:hypothetical protein
MTKRLLLFLALTLAVAVPVAVAPAASTSRSSHSPVTVGIAEQLPKVFTDSRFLALHVTHARIDLAWDVLRDGGQKAAADVYMQAARKAHADVVITFDHSRRGGHQSINPTTTQLVHEMQAMRARWPGLHEFSTWNEVNVAKQPAIVAKWWLALIKACPTCTILGADVLDRSATSDSAKATSSSIHRWVAGFLKATHGRQPTAWGLHNYTDANKGRTSGTRALLSAVKGKVWFTETGGIVSRHNGSPFKLPEGVTHARNTTKFILTTLDRVSPRVQRVYLYDWTQSVKTWDSAFVSSHGVARPSLTYLRQFLGRA